MNYTEKLTPDESKALKSLKKILARKYNILQIKLYGSKARGNSNPESDIDIMIELEDLDYKLQSEILEIIYDFNLEYDLFISPIFMSRKQIIDGPVSESPIYKSIQREGLQI